MNMPSPSNHSNQPSQYHFGEFVVDVADRQLWRGSDRLDLNARYFDALVLLLREEGRLVEKDELFDRVWNDVVVSESALTQCIKEIRRLLGDNAQNPLYIQTVPRHGYRFVGEVQKGSVSAPGVTAEHRGDSAGSVMSESVGPSVPRPEPISSPLIPASPISWATIETGLKEWRAIAVGGAVAGVFGGMMYGFVLAPSDGGAGSLSTLLVLVSLNVLVGLAGGIGVGLGFALAGITSRILPTLKRTQRILGASLGGLVLGTFVKLLGVDAFNVLFGRAPAGITGGPEGAFLGAFVLLGAYAGEFFFKKTSRPTNWYAVIGGGIGGGVAGVLIPWLGGNLMGGSLSLLADSFAESRLQLDRFGPFFGELHFGGATQMALGFVEGLLFGACIIAALVLLKHQKPTSFSE